MAAFILFPGPVFQGLRETACSIFIVGQAIFETTVIDLQIIIMGRLLLCFIISWHSLP